MLHSQVVDLVDEIFGLMSAMAFCPLAAIANAPFLVIDADSAAFGDALIGTSLNRLLEEVS